MGHGDTGLPVDRVGIKNQLSFGWLLFMEDEHPVAAHDDKFLLLVRVEPAYEDAGADARPKLEVRHGDIGNLRVQEIAAD